jgi:spore maturation protein CgeB
MARAVRFGIRGFREPMMSINLHPTNHPDRNDRIVIVGNGGDCHVGAHFMEAADLLGWTSELVDIEQIPCSKWQLRIYWRLLGRRDPRARALGKRLLSTCDRVQPDWVLVTGRIPLEAPTIRQLKQQGVRIVNFMTDDPWNPKYICDWLLDALVEYDSVFTPRTANLYDFQKLLPNLATYLPFAFSVSKHEATKTSDGFGEDLGDVLFVGGADADRVTYARAFRESGLRLVLYGGLWDRYPDLLDSWMGIGDLSTVREACARCKITLVLPRHANRDGHTMRSFESAASRGCILAEDTRDHRLIYGVAEGDNLLFTGLSDMVEKASDLARSQEARRARRDAVYSRIVGDGGNTYCDRLQAIKASISRSDS